MLTVPTELPVTTPPATLAVAGAVLLQAPPPTVSVKVTVLPVHTVALTGDKAAGVTNTVTDLVATQPAAVVYRIFTVPAAIPVTIPEVPTVAVAGEALLHVPPAVRSPRVAVAPSHIVTAPGGVIAEGLAFTVNKAVALHDPPVLYVIVTFPGVTPVTIPDPEPTEATAGLLLLHVPPPVVLLNVEVRPTQALKTPVMAPGVLKTVSFRKTEFEPQELEMV